MLELASMPLDDNTVSLNCGMLIWRFYVEMFCFCVLIVADTCCFCLLHVFIYS